MYRIRTHEMNAGAEGAAGDRERSPKIKKRSVRAGRETIKIKLVERLRKRIVKRPVGARSVYEIEQSVNTK